MNGVQGSLRTALLALTLTSCEAPVPPIRRLQLYQQLLTAAFVAYLAKQRHLTLFWQPATKRVA